MATVHGFYYFNRTAIKNDWYEQRTKEYFNMLNLLESLLKETTSVSFNKNSNIFMSNLLVRRFHRSCDSQP